MLVDLKLPRKKKSEEKNEAMTMPSDDGNKYPYGMTIRIEGDTLKKFSSLDKVKAGQEVNITALATVKEVRRIDKDTAGEYEDNVVSLQITKMELSMEDDLDKAFDED